jgi:hypothetical protein
MAIKGKGKTKPKQAARAPRRAPVPVKPPMFQRGWVRALAAFLAGVLVLSVTWWAWENINAERARDDVATAQGLQREAVTSWGKGNLEPTLATVGQLQGGGAPQIATDVSTALDAVDNGTEPDVTATDMAALGDELEKAAKELEKFDMSGAISDHGFDKSQTDVITTVQTEIASSLRTFAIAARLTARVIDDPADAELVADAREAYTTAQTLLQRGWNSYANIAAVAGVPLQAATGLPLGG